MGGRRGTVGFVIRFLFHEGFLCNSIVRVIRGKRRRVRHARRGFRSLPHAPSQKKARRGAYALRRARSERFGRLRLTRGGGATSAADGRGPGSEWEAARGFSLARRRLPFR